MPDCDLSGISYRLERLAERLTKNARVPWPYQINFVERRLGIPAVHQLLDSIQSALAPALQVLTRQGVAARMVRTMHAPDDDTPNLTICAAGADFCFDALVWDHDGWLAQVVLKVRPQASLTAHFPRLTPTPVYWPFALLTVKDGAPTWLSVPWELRARFGLGGVPSAFP